MQPKKDIYAAADTIQQITNLGVAQTVGQLGDVHDGRNGWFCHLVISSQLVCSGADHPGPQIPKQKEGVHKSVPKLGNKVLCICESRCVYVVLGDADTASIMLDQCVFQLKCLCVVVMS